MNISGIGVNPYASQLQTAGASANSSQIADAIAKVVQQLETQAQSGSTTAGSTSASGLSSIAQSIGANSGTQSAHFHHIRRGHDPLGDNDASSSTGSAKPVTGSTTQAMDNILNSLSSSNPTVQSYLTALQSSEQTTPTSTSTAASAAQTSTPATTVTSATAQSQLATDLMSVFGGSQSSTANPYAFLGVQNGGLQGMNATVMNLLSTQGLGLAS